MCLQETFLKDIDSITVTGFNLYHKFYEIENRASVGVSILVNENLPQSIFNDNLQAVAVKVTAHTTITLCSVYLPPRNHFNLPIEPFLVPASVPPLVYQRLWYVLSSLWDDAYKRTLAANQKA